MAVTSEQVKALAAECGFELAGVTPAVPLEDFGRFEAWRQSGYAGEMRYLTDRRGDLRRDPRTLLPEAQTIICVGKLYNSPGEAHGGPEQGLISRYAWGDGDYHEILRDGLGRLAARIGEAHGEAFAWRICVDTAPLLERSYAQAAGLGWVGKNTCLINQQSGSWFFLGELLVSIPLAADTALPFRCGSCTRCIDACPTEAIVPASGGESGWAVDATLCISYLTIEKRGVIEPGLETGIGNHVFGCDICQEVCPWNRRAPESGDERFAARPLDLGLLRLSELTPDEFRALFRSSPVWRSKYESFLRNVAIALGNSGGAEAYAALERLGAHPNKVVASTATQSLGRREEADLR